MTGRKEFWLALMAGALLFYARALWFLLQGQTGESSVIIAGIVLSLHLLEIPVAFRLLKDRNPQSLRLITMTLIFGLLWFLPARRGIFAVR